MISNRNVKKIEIKEKTEDLFKLIYYNSRDDIPIKEKDRESNQDNKETTTLEVLSQMEKTKGKFKFY